MESIGAPDQKGCLGQVHLSGHLLHPHSVASGGKQAHSRGISGVWLVGKRVDLGETLDGIHSITASTSISTTMSGEISRLTSIIVAAGRMSPKNSPCALPISLH